VLESLSRSSILRPKLCDGTDAARGVLASIVFIGHVGQIFFGDFLGLDVAPDLAVLFFFAISGFVIAGSLARHTGPSDTVDLMEFAKRRFFRIMPPLLATFLLIVALEFALSSSGVVSDQTRALNPNVPGVHGYHLNLFKVAVSLLTIGAVGDLGGGLDGPLWSLRYEIRCYLTAALVAWLSTSRAATAQKATVVLILCAYWFVAFFIRNEGPLSQLPYLLSFAAGFFVFRYRSALAARGPIVTASALVLASATSLVLFSAGHPQVVPSWLLLVKCVCACAFALTVFVLHGVEIKSRVLAALGGVSYTLYIAHFPILLALYLFIKTTPGPMHGPLTAAAILATAVACFVLGRGVERSSAQLAWTERHILRIRTSRAVRAPQG
jgi:peptidoglycan/LPS O-acetylase OafA/YrhL